MKIFPHVLVRVGGGAFSRFVQVSVEELAASSRQLQAMHQEQAARKQLLSERLLECIRNLADSKSQNAVQNVRRDVYNDRFIKPAILESVRRILPEGLRAELDQYLTFTAQLQLHVQEAKLLYEREVRRQREHLQRLTGEDNLQKGLILSSQSLFNQLADYCQKDPATFRKKEFQVEHSLLKYLTRIYTKTSPFSTFNNLALGRLVEVAYVPLALTADQGQVGEVQSHIRLNNLLYRYLKDLLVCYRPVRLRLPIRSNPTIEVKGDFFVYLVNHNNQEAFQRVPRSPVIALLWQLTADCPAGIQYSILLEEVQSFIEASTEELDDYLKQLIDYGFFEYDLGVSGIDPNWDLKLVEVLQPLAADAVPGIGELISCLQHVRSLAQEYARAEVRTRRMLLIEAYETFRNVCLRLHEAAGLPEEERQPYRELLFSEQEKRKHLTHEQQVSPEAAVAEASPPEETPQTDPATEEVFTRQSVTFFTFKPEQLFYEDTTRQVEAQFDAAQLKRVVSVLDTLLRELHLFKGNVHEREQMKHFLREKYGETACVNLLTFYEEYYRSVKRPEAERLAQQRKKVAQMVDKLTSETEPKANQQHMPTLPPAVAQRREQMKQWATQYGAAITPLLNREADSVSLRLAEIQSVNRQFGMPRASTSNPFGAFLQFFQEPDEEGQMRLKGVINATLIGYGRMLSRFLHILPWQVTEDLRTWNGLQVDQNSLFIENTDASYSNANLHPPLMPYEIRVPGGHNSLPPAQQLPVTDFEVTYDADKDEIKLVHSPSAKHANVFDLGFQGSMGRSPLFQLLTTFTNADCFFVEPLVDVVNASLLKDKTVEGGVVVLPRVVYESCLVLQRKSWRIPVALLPVRQPTDDDFAYYQSIQTWRQSLGMPDEVFVFIHTRKQPTDADPERQHKLGRDDYKPQYIHFGNPLLVNLFGKLVAKTPVLLKVEEMLPHSGHLATVNQEKFVTEYVVQWYGHGGEG